MPPLEQTFTLKELIFAIFMLVGACIIRFLVYLMPKTAKIIVEHWKREINEEINEKLDKLTKDLDDLTEIKGVSEYRDEKHNMEGELLNLKEALVNDDQVILKELRALYIKRKEGGDA